jgi:hypothetical protein
MIPTLLTDDINTIVLAIARTYHSGKMVLMSSVNKVGIMHRGWASINRSVETGLSVVF